MRETWEAVVDHIQFPVGKFPRKSRSVLLLLICKDFFLFMCMCVHHLCVHRTKEGIRFPGPGYRQLWFIHQTWVLGTKLRPSGKGASAFNFWAISLAPASVYHTCVFTCKIVTGIQIKWECRDMRGKQLHMGLMKTVSLFLYSSLHFRY